MLRSIGLNRKGFAQKVDCSVAYLNQLLNESGATKKQKLQPRHVDDIVKALMALGALPTPEAAIALRATLDPTLILPPSRVVPRACPTPLARPTYFGGRQADLVAVSDMLQQGAPRVIVALVGARGIGKTTLAR